MMWLTWRLVRLQTVVLALGVAAVAVLATLTGPRLADLARQTAEVYDRTTGADRNLFYAGVAALAILPPLIGVFWGAPLVAGELETGSHRLAWTQSVTRSRWLATRLGLTVAIAAGAMGALSLIVTRWSDPLDGAVSATRGSLPGRLTPITFAMRGLVPVAATVLAVVLGACAGAILRRTLPAMAVVLVLHVALQLTMALWLRGHLITPVTSDVAIGRETLDGIRLGPSGPQLTVRPVNRGDWLITNVTIDPDGHPAPLPASFVECLPAPPAAGADAGATRVAGADPKACLDQLGAAGYHQRVTYQPIGRFWALQWAETGVYLALAGLAGGLCLWWVNRRLT